MPPSVIDPIENLGALENQAWRDYAALLLRSVHGRSNAGDAAALPLLAQQLRITSNTVLEHAGAIKEALSLVELARELPGRRKAVVEAEAAAAKFRAELEHKVRQINNHIKDLQRREGQGEEEYWYYYAQRHQHVWPNGEKEHKRMLSEISSLQNRVVEASGAVSRIQSLRSQYRQIFEFVPMELPV